VPSLWGGLALLQILQLGFIYIKNRELGNLDSWNDGTTKMVADVKSGTQNT
jgi:hypothetical protein